MFFDHLIFRYDIFTDYSCDKLFCYYIYFYIFECHNINKKSWNINIQENTYYLMIISYNNDNILNCGIIY